MCGAPHTYLVSWHESPPVSLLIIFELMRTVKVILPLYLKDERFFDKT